MSKPTQPNGTRGLVTPPHPSGMIATMPRPLPSGTVTLLFTDVEGSTRLLHALGAEAYTDALATHRSLLRKVFTRHGGIEVDTQGDAFFVAFPHTTVSPPLPVASLSRSSQPAKSRDSRKARGVTAMTA